jgi:hypothetical protein
MVLWCVGYANCNMGLAIPFLNMEAENIGHYMTYDAGQYGLE